MINDNKEDFMYAVSIESAKYREKSFEACMDGFLKSIIRKSIELDVPTNISDTDKLKLANEVKGTINESVNQIVNNAFTKDDTDKAFDVDIANEIVNPKNFTESISKAVAEHVFAESNDRTTVLEAQHDAGVLNGKTSEEAYKFIQDSFENVNFDSKFSNGLSLNTTLKTIFSNESDELVNDIKSDVLNLISDTESKNSVIREAVADINKKKEEIEKNINGDAAVDTTTKDESSTSDDTSDTPSTQDTSSDNTSTDNDTSPDTTNTDDTTASSESFKNNLLNIFRPITKRDLYTIVDNVTGKHELGKENLYTEIDKTSFSKESAEDVLKQFQQLNDGIDVDSIPENENTLSVSEDDSDKKESCDEGDPDDKDEKKDTNSQENTYTNDDGDTIEPDSSKFEYDDVVPDDLDDDDKLSEESFAKDFLPLSINKMVNISPVINSNKFAAFLACKKDRGEEFFNDINNRSVLFTNLMSKEDTVCDSIAKDDVNNKLSSILGLCNETKEKVNTITEDLGILGILDGEYQRTDSPTDNAVKSLANPSLIKHEDLVAKSKEALEENEYAQIFKLALKLSDIQSDIASGVNVYQNTKDLGDIEALLNEKIYEIPVEETKFEVESKVKALQSLESIIPFEDMVNMQVFVSKSEGKPAPERIKLDSIKDIDAYGYSCIDEIEKIKSDITKKFSDKVTDKNTGFNVDVSKLVDYVVEQEDTTKLDANFYEKVISKLIEDKTISNSTEGMIIRNKAKTIVTSFVTADKLGFLSSEDINDLQKNLI